MDANENNWGNATFALFDIVNRQLEDTPYRFYAIYGGNDLSGMFLTEEACDEAILSLPRKMDWPYLPTPKGPCKAYQPQMTETQRPAFVESYRESSSASATSFSRTPGTKDRGRCTAQRLRPLRSKKLTE